jgi:hypothetical protein
LAPFDLWLVIEVVSFYLQIVEVFIYVAAHQVNQEMRDRRMQDIRGEVTDFIVYSKDQLNWFAFDFQLLAIPFILLLVIN